MEYRTLSRAEIGQLAQLDRTETVERIYYPRDGTLVLEQEHWDVPDWSAAEKQQRIAELQALYDRGATFWGAYHQSLLVGMAALEHRPLPSGVRRLNLAGLWVSRAYRGQGVGRALVRLAAQAARTRGARTLYVSATPSEHTIHFYLSVGFRLAALIDPELFAREPEDIHLEWNLQDEAGVS
ncbi:MAG: GNAT family N-acetyltransferase [Chloroflexi bacterium]|jgi:GNAT superfamily N-acetyltransferase|nr:GNAT family N-acetyltransferase [Chloroflexota bacterium]